MNKDLNPLTRYPRKNPRIRSGLVSTGSHVNSAYVSLTAVNWKFAGESWGSKKHLYSTYISDPSVRYSDF